MRYGRCKACGEILPENGTRGKRWRKLCPACAPEHYNRIPRSCCTILKKHAADLKDDPEHLTTDFIRGLSRCGCPGIISSENGVREHTDIE
jgi:hypothetical protein